jgi:hypothetical protein
MTEALEKAEPEFRRRTRAYFSDLWARLDQSVELIPKVVQYANGAVPEHSRCHQNADRWIAENPSYGVVRGYVREGCFFIAHSVVRAPSGALIDLTSSKSLRFLEHAEDSAFWEWLRVNAAQIQWPLNEAPEQPALPSLDLEGPDV